MKINIHNEALKGDRKFALQVKNTYDKLLKDLSSKVRLDQKYDQRDGVSWDNLDISWE